MSNPTERNYGNTGASSGPAQQIIRINNKDPEAGKFFLGKETLLGDTLAGYLDGVDLEWRDAIAEHDIPAHWCVNLRISADLGEGPKTYMLPIPSYHRNPVMSSIVNGLAGAMANLQVWTTHPQLRFIRIWVTRKQKPGKKAYTSVLIFGSDTKGDYLPNLYPYNEGLQRYEGVPDELDEGELFWLSVADRLREKTGGIQINANKATYTWQAKYPSNGAAPTQPTNTAPAHVPPPPVQQPSTPPPAGTPGMTAEAFWDVVNKNYMKGTSPDDLLIGLKSSLAGWKSKNPGNVTERDIYDAFTAKLHSLGLGGQFLITDNGPKFDDLPF